MLRAMSAIANSGTLVTAHVMQDSPLTFQKIAEDLQEADYEVVRDGLRAVITEGTGQILNVPYVRIAAKTGTAQTSFKNLVNSWVIGFFPYEKPKYAFVVLMEKGPSKGERSASFAMRTFIDWVNQNVPEYFEIDSPEV